MNAFRQRGFALEASARARGTKIGQARLIFGQAGQAFSQPTATLFECKPYIVFKNRALRKFLHFNLNVRGFAVVQTTAGRPITFLIGKELTCQKLSEPVPPDVYLTIISRRQRIALA